MIEWQVTLKLKLSIWELSWLIICQKQTFIINKQHSEHTLSPRNLNSSWWFMQIRKANFWKNMNSDSTMALALPHVKLNIGNTCFQQFFRLTLRFSNFSYGTPWQFSHWSMLLYCWLQPFLFTNIWKIKTIHLLQTLLRTMTKVLIVRR